MYESLAEIDNLIQEAHLRQTLGENIIDDLQELNYARAALLKEQEVENTSDN